MTLENPQPDWAHTIDANIRRQDKAESIADWMLDNGIVTVPDVNGRREIRKAMGLPRDPSTETWSLAITRWQERQ